MKIKIRSKERNFTIPIPNILFFNSATAAIITWAMNKAWIDLDVMQIPSEISYQNLKRFFRVMRKCRKYMNGEPLVYAYSKEEGTVEVYL